MRFWIHQNHISYILKNSYVCTALEYIYFRGPHPFLRRVSTPFQFTTVLFPDFAIEIQIEYLLCVTLRNTQYFNPTQWV